MLSKTLMYIYVYIYIVSGKYVCVFSSFRLPYETGILVLIQRFLFMRHKPLILTALQFAYSDANPLIVHYI